MLVGGGRAFGLTPKGPDGWKRKVNRKEEQLGLRVGLSEKWRAGNLVVVEKLGLGEVSTRVLKGRLASRGWLDALFVLAGDPAPEDVEAREAFVLASGNLEDVAVVSEVEKLGVWEIVKRRKVVMELAAVDELIRKMDPEGRLGVEDEEYQEGELEVEELARELEEALEGEEGLEKQA